MIVCAKMSIGGWISFFQEVSSLIETSERHFGIASSSLADHLTERFELAVQSCEYIVACLDNPSVTLNDDEQSIVAGYKREVDELIGWLRSHLDQWKDYRMLLDSTSTLWLFISSPSCTYWEARQTKV